MGLLDNLLSNIQRQGHPDRQPSSSANSDVAPSESVSGSSSSSSGFPSASASAHDLTAPPANTLSVPQSWLRRVSSALSLSPSISVSAQEPASPSSSISEAADAPVDAHAVAQAWLARLTASLASQKEDDVAQLFAPIAVFRDSLVFSWNVRSLAGPAPIASYILSGVSAGAGSSRGQVTDIKLDTREGLGPFVLPFDQPGAVSLSWTFTTPLGQGRGTARLYPPSHYSGEPAAAKEEWVADSAFVMLDAFEGHEEARLRMQKDPAAAHHIAFEVSDAERRRKVEEDPFVLIVGAGQTGLMLAARFQQLGLPTLVVEKQARVGDEWRSRYRTLKLHTPMEQHTFLYSPYPSTWPKWTAKEKLADWMEAYSKTHDLVLWTGSPLLSSPAPTYSAEDGCWTAHVGRPDGSVQIIKPKHIVLATGTLGAANMPTVPGIESFTGTALHASKFHSGADYKDKRVIVVGGANTAADVCEDLYCSGAASVTMVQRSETCVCLAGELKFFYDAIFPAGVDAELSDFRLAGVPTRTRERLILGLREERRRQGLNPDVVPGDEDKLEGLKKAGFLLNHGPGNKGIIWRIFERFGGHFVDTGFADYLIEGKVALKTRVEVANFTPTGVTFTDGSTAEADAVIFATGYHPAEVLWSSIFGKEVIDQAGPVWGLDDEGELKGVFRPTGHPGLWYAGGDFAASRWGSKQLGLLLQAKQLGFSN